MTIPHGAQEIPFEQLRFCPTCNKNTQHKRWDERAMWTCTEHKEERIDLDAYHLMEKRLADCEAYNAELLGRLRTVAAASKHEELEESSDESP